MKAKIFKHTFAIMSLTVVLISCKKGVEINSPITLTSPTDVFKTDYSAIAAQMNLYASMYADPYKYHYYTATGSDEYTSFSTNATDLDLYKNSLSANGPDPAVIGIWTQNYNYLYQVNAILEGIASSTGLSDVVRRQTKGEALFMRAYYDFYLTNFYGDVPIVTTTDYKTIQALPRSSQSDVYKQVINDLHQAQSLLSPNYLDATDLAISPDHIRPTKWAATALLARTYLYNKNWTGADSAASALIDNPNYQLSPLTGATSVFKKNSLEAIWQITGSTDNSGNATYDGYYTVMINPPSAGSIEGNVTISSQLLASFEPNDQRKVNWIGIFQAGGNSYNFPYKYKNGPNAPALTEYTMIFRLGEQYLIRAEARVYENNPSGAVADLNKIRNRAGLPNYNGGADNASLLAAILHERQVELFGEAHRWFDLRRSGNINAVMGSPGNVTIVKGGVNWNSYQQYYPIPEGDVNSSSNLTQTVGY